MRNPAGFISFLWRYIAPWKKDLALSLCALSLVSVTTLVYPWLLKLMVDDFQSPSEGGTHIGILVLALAALFVCSTLLGYYQQITMHKLGYRLRNSLRADLFQSLLNHPLSFHRSQQVGELSARATEDVGKSQGVFTNLVAPVFQNSLIVCGGTAVTFLLNPWAAAVLLLFLILPMPFVLRFSRLIRKLASKSQAEHAMANACFDESLVAIREVKAFAIEETLWSRYVGLLSKAFATEVSASRLVIKGSQAAYFLLSIMLLTTFYLAAIQALPGWTLGSMVAFYFYAYTIAMSVLSTGRIYLTFQNVTGALQRVEELVMSTRSNVDTGPPKHSGSLIGSIELEGVNFSYDSESLVLCDVSASIPDGEWAVFTGPSGAGKSTVAHLIMGLYEPQSGQVKIGGIPVSGWDKEALRNQMGYVGQDPFLFHGSLRENLMIGTKAINETALKEILRVACLEDVVSGMPDGLETVVGERGYTLSGGQKSRVAIARALIVSPAILILDEANAMLEPRLEQEIWNRLRQHRESRTTIVFTHHTERIPGAYRYFVFANHSVQPVSGLPAGQEGT
jgi:ATP-binding cassette subfamily B protein